MNRKEFVQAITAGGAGLLASSSLAGRTSPTGIALGDLGSASWQEIRSLFPLRSEVVYLNTGGLGPVSRPVLDRVCQQNLEQAVIGEHFKKLFEGARETASDFLGTTTSEIAFVRNASEGNSVISSGLSLKRGDEVVFESHAHPGGSFAWLNRQKLDGVKVRIFEPSAESPAANLQRLFDEVGPRTRVIQVSHITATTGLFFDVHAIAAEAKRRGIWFHIDGAQSAGMIPLDLKEIGCDSYATSGHKWLNGPIETGMLYISAERNNEVTCCHVGSYSDDGYELPSEFSYVGTAQRHEYGTRNAASVLGLQEAMLMQKAIGRERIAAHGARLASMAREGIQSIDGLEILSPLEESMRSSMLTFRVPRLDCVKIYSALSRDHKLRCRVVTERDLNGVRSSWHVYHDEQDVERFVEGVRAVVSTL